MKIIGIIEKVKIRNIDYDGNAKVDTGAYHSSISIKSIEEVKNRLKVTFFNDVNYETSNYYKSEVKSSNGISELRYFIKLSISIKGSRFHRTDFSLAKRDDMKNKILIGRKSIPKGYLIDAQKYKID